MESESLSKIDKLALFMDFGVYKVPGKDDKFYTRELLTENIVSELNELSELNQGATDFGYIKNFRGGGFFINHWNPYVDRKQAIDCENKLVEVGKYHATVTNYSLSGLSEPVPINQSERIFFVTFSNSLKELDISGEGGSRLEAVCDACVNFIDRGPLKDYSENYIKKE